MVFLLPVRHPARLRLQEQFSLDVSGRNPQNDYTAALLWQEGETTYLSHPQVHLVGGQTAKELTKEQQWWYEEELERLGHLRYTPYFSFSIPQKATALGGYLAYTADASEQLDRENTYDYYDFTHLLLRRQTALLHYPFRSIDDLGGLGSLALTAPFTPPTEPLSTPPPSPSNCPSRRNSRRDFLPSSGKAGLILIQ